MRCTYQTKETIAAITTPPGEGAVSVIRISGSGAYELGAAIFSGPVGEYKSHTAHYGNILSKEGKTLDSVLVLVMKGPRSYTGEDTVEIFCHGGSLVTRRVLERVFEAGARPALPGEFSFRAYMNGKLDLAQAEAVQQLIAAKSDLALEAAEKQLHGALSQQVVHFQKELTRVAAILEAWIDFPEEGLEFASFEAVIGDLSGVCSAMEKLCNTFHEGKMLHDGLSLCLLGAPNVGKSSLMNALLGKERAIVTEVAGTTRDLIEDDLRLGGLHFRLVDTAGIRETDERVEQEGIRRSRAALIEADVVLFLLDASRPVTPEEETLLAQAPAHKTIVVWNKTDIAPPGNGRGVAISALEKKGLDDLKGAIEKLIWKQGPPSKEEVVITKQRHQTALVQAIAHCQRVIEGLRQKTSPELVTSDLRACLHELGTLIGTDVTEDILTAIFSQFCLGK